MPGAFSLLPGIGKAKQVLLAVVVDWTFTFFLWGGGGGGEGGGCCGSTLTYIVLKYISLAICRMLHASNSLGSFRGEDNVVSAFTADTHSSRMKPYTKRAFGIWFHS